MIGKSLKKYKRGDFVVYRKAKHSSCPGPRAKNVYPAELGENYSYVIDKFWVVVQANDDGTVLLQTRRGKTHLVNSDDPNLRHVSLWERFHCRNRFPSLEEDSSPVFN